MYWGRPGGHQRVGSRRADAGPPGSDAGERVPSAEVIATVAVAVAVVVATVGAGTGTGLAAPDRTGVGVTQATPGDGADAPALAVGNGTDDARADHGTGTDRRVTGEANATDDGDANVTASGGTTASEAGDRTGTGTGPVGVGVGNATRIRAGPGGGTATDVDEVVVAADGSGDYRTIRAGVTNATVGARVYVMPGVYDPRDVHVNRSLRIVGLGGVVVRTKSSRLDEPANLVVGEPNGRQAVTISGIEFVGYHTAVDIRDASVALTVEESSFAAHQIAVDARNSTGSVTLRDVTTATDSGTGSYPGVLLDAKRSAATVRLDGVLLDPSNVNARRATGDWTVEDVTGATPRGGIENATLGVGSGDVRVTDSSFGEFRAQAHWADGPPGRNVTLRNLTAESAAVEGATRVTIAGGRIGEIRPTNALADPVGTTSWRITGTRVGRIVPDGVHADGDGDDWRICDARLGAAGFDANVGDVDVIDAEDDPGDWTLRNVTLVGPASGGTVIRATDTSGNWTVTGVRSAGEGATSGRYVGVDAGGTTGSVRVADATLTEVDAAGASGSVAVGNVSFHGHDGTTRDIGVDAVGVSGSLVVANSSVRGDDDRFRDVGVDAAGASGSVTITNGTFRRTDVGVRATRTRANGSVAVTGSEFRNNTLAVNASAGRGQVRVGASNVVGNRRGVIGFGASPAVDATDNWWGREAGPLPWSCEGAVDCSGYVGTARTAAPEILDVQVDPVEYGSDGVSILPTPIEPGDHLRVRVEFRLPDGAAPINGSASVVTTALPAVGEQGVAVGPDALGPRDRLLRAWNDSSIRSEHRVDRIRDVGDGVVVGWPLPLSDSRRLTDEGLVPLDEPGTYRVGVRLVTEDRRDATVFRTFDVGENTTRLEGTVRGPDGPVSGATVYAYRVGRTSDVDLGRLTAAGTGEADPPGTYTGRVTTDATGHYEMAGLTPGQYWVLADPRDRSTLLPRLSGTETVTERQTTTVDLRVVESPLGKFVPEGVEAAADAETAERTRAAADVYVAGANYFVDGGTVVDSRQRALNGMLAVIDALTTRTPGRVDVAGMLLDAGWKLMEAGFERQAVEQFQSLPGPRRAALADDAAAVEDTRFLDRFEHRESVDDAVVNGYRESTVYRTAATTRANATRRYERVAGRTGEVPTGFASREVDSILRETAAWLRGDGPVEGVVVSPTGEVRLTNRTAARRAGFYGAKRVAEGAEDVGTASQTVAVFGGATAPYTAVFGQVLAVVGFLGQHVSEVIKLLAVNRMGGAWAETQVTWAADLDGVAAVHADTVEWLIDEVESPTLARMDGEGAALDVRADLTCGSLPNLSCPEPSTDVVVANAPPGARTKVYADKRADVTVVNTGSEPAPVRVLLTDHRVGFGEGATGDGGGDGERVSAFASVYPNVTAGPAELAPGESERVTLPYVASLDPLDPWEWHVVRAHVWVGGRITDVKTQFVVVVPVPGPGFLSAAGTSAPVGAGAAGGGNGPVVGAGPVTATRARDPSGTAAGTGTGTSDAGRRTVGFAATSAASGDGPVALREWSRYVDRPRRLLDTELSASTASASASLNVPANASSVTVLAYATDGDAVDLNVTDAAGRHAGYSAAAGGAVVAIPNASYNGAASDPERVRIADAGGRSLDIEARFVRGAVESTSVAVYAVVTPERPALLSVAPDRIDLATAPGGGDGATVTLAEVGDQHAVRGAAVSVDRAALTTPDGRPLPDGVTVTADGGPADIAPDDRRRDPVNVSVDPGVSFDGVHTRFSGPFTITTDNAGSVEGTASILLLNASVAGVTLRRADRSVTGVHLTKRVSGGVNASTVPGRVRKVYRVRVVGNGSATVGVPAGKPRTAYVRTGPGEWRPTGRTTDGTVAATVPAGEGVIVVVDPPATPFPDGVPGVPGTTPTDPDGDGLFEDVDGDGRATYADVVALALADFEAIAAAPAGSAPFDYNDNGRLDFDDVVHLFASL